MSEFLNLKFSLICSQIFTNLSQLSRCYERFMEPSTSIVVQRLKPRRKLLKRNVPFDTNNNVLHCAHALKLEAKIKFHY